MVCGQGDNTVAVDAFYQAELDLQTLEQIEDIPSDQYTESILIGYVYRDRESVEDQPEKIGISFYDMKT